MLELTLARTGHRLWGEMKENAQLASDHPHNIGAIQLVAQYVELAKKKLAGAGGRVMFIYSETSTQASSAEAFGIKLNVTHPSLILVLAGVGRLAERVLHPGRVPVNRLFLQRALGEWARFQPAFGQGQPKTLAAGVHFNFG